MGKQPIDTTCVPTFGTEWIQQSLYVGTLQLQVQNIIFQNPMCFINVFELTCSIEKSKYYTWRCMSLFFVSFVIKWIVDLLGHCLHLLNFFSLDIMVKINMFFHGCYNFVTPLDLWCIMRCPRFQDQQHHYGKYYIS